MNEDSGKKRRFEPRMWLTAGLLCVGCCSLPLIAAVLGAASIAGLAVYFEQGALALLLAVAVFVVVRRLMRASAPACRVSEPSTLT